MNRKDSAMLRNLAVPTVIILIIAAIASACGGDASGENSEPTIPAPAYTPTPAIPDPETGPTGVTVLDLAIDALEARDFDGFKALLLFAPEACVPPGQGAGGPPDCRSGEATGTPVDVIPGASCEGFWLREDVLLQALGPLFQTAPRLHGVYRADTQLFDRAGEYAVVFDISIAEGPMAANVIMTGEGVVGVNFGCGESAEQMVEAGEFDDVVFVPEDVES
jgi:hypothetical protein